MLIKQNPVKSNILFFFFGCVGSLVVARGIFLCHAQALRCGMWVLSPVVAWGSFLSPVVARGSFLSPVVACGLLSSCGSWAPEHVGSVVVAHGLSCPTACEILVPQLGIKLASPAFQDGFYTTGPPGKSQV